MYKLESFVQECNHCNNAVIFEELYRYSDQKINQDYSDIEGYPSQIEKVLFRCNKCKEISLFSRASVLSPVDGNPFTNGDWFDDWTDYYRLYPKKIYLDYSVPKIIKESFGESQKLYENGFFNPAMTSLRRTLENICIEKRINKKLKLEDKLKKLLELNIIDQKLYDWGEALRLAGNLTAHSNEQIKKEDLQDMFDFIEFMINYIFVLSIKFESYKARHVTTPKPAA